MDGKLIFDLARQVIEFAEKTHQLVKLKVQCQEIANRSRKVISKKVIDDVFDVMAVLIKNACKTPDDISKIQKFVYRRIAYGMFVSNNILINRA